MDSKEFTSQKIRVYQSLKKSPKTRLMLALELGILRGNVCYFVRDFRKSNQIGVFKVGYDPITGHKAEFLTTDPALFPKTNQTELFNEGE